MKKYLMWYGHSRDIIDIQQDYRMYRQAIRYSLSDNTSLPEEVKELILNDANRQINSLPRVATFYYSNNRYWVEINGEDYLLERQDFNVLPTQEEFDLIKDGSALYCFLEDGDHRHPDTL